MLKHITIAAIGCLLGFAVRAQESVTTPAGTWESRRDYDHLDKVTLFISLQKN